MRRIDEIIIHCSATSPEWMLNRGAVAQALEIDKWHKSKGWKGIGYHFVISRDGSRANGRPVASTGAHTKGRNLHSIGVCLIGGMTSSPTDLFEEHYTPAQDTALRELINELQGDLPKAVPLHGHNEYANKACPGFNVAQWYTTKSETKPNWVKAIIDAIIDRFKGSKK